MLRSGLAALGRNCRRSTARPRGLSSRFACSGSAVVDRQLRRQFDTSRVCHRAGNLFKQVGALLIERVAPRCNRRAEVFDRPNVRQVGRNEGVRQQEGARLLAERSDVEDRTLRECALPADGVNAADEAAKPFQDANAVQLRVLPTAPGIDREAMSGEDMQGPPLQRERGDHRHFVRGELGDERVLLVDLRVALAQGSIELDHDGRRDVAMHEVDAILVAAEGQQPPVSAHADVVERIEDAARRQVGLGRGGGGILWHTAL